MQSLLKKDLSRAAGEVLDGVVESKIPDVAEMAAFWGLFVSQASTPFEGVNGPRPREHLKFIWNPVSCEEAEGVKIDLSSAPGADGITARLWRAVPPCIKALLFNIIMASGSFPPSLLVSRTVFVPKKVGGSNPADFRPISIASVVVRHFHKVLAARLRAANIVDVRQRCFDDGCAENVSLLATLLEDSRSTLKELHLCSLDVAKAFDSVSHDAIADVLVQNGLPPEFCAYIKQIYATSQTTFEVEGVRSELYNSNRGVRQGDPLSGILFSLVVDAVLSAIPNDVGYTLGESRVDACAYADDIVLVASSAWGMRKALRAVEGEAGARGLLFSAQKCTALSIVPAGKLKKYKVLTEPQFQLEDGVAIRQLTPSQEWRYLGVDFRPIGPKRAGGDIKIYLERLTRAPLKPQQRLKILRCYVIPRLYHSLVLAGSTLGKLKALDVQVRLAVRKWLRFPHDTPVGYFHAPCADGGLGLPAFTTTIPGLLMERISHMAKSSFPAVREVPRHPWAEKRLQWAERALTKDGLFLNTKEKRSQWWTQRLYRSVDGSEIRESGKTPTVSNRWIDQYHMGIPGRDYVQYHHVRVNCLPTRVRTSRGTRNGPRDVQCRAGCQATETAAHVIQVCHRTHGGRIKRHNAVCRVVATALRNAGWAVTEEPRFRTSAGLRKPDLVAAKGAAVRVIDAQIVSGATPLDQAHERKVQYYAGNEDLCQALCREHGVERNAVSFSSCTLSWRGVWARASAVDLLACGLTKRCLSGITTRVLQGSHTNWVQWNKMTSMAMGVRGAIGCVRQGVG